MIYHDYISFSVDSSFYRLPQKTQKDFKNEFLKEIQKEKDVLVYTYSTLGLKNNTVFLFWLQANALEEIQYFISVLLHTQLGSYLAITYTFFGMTRTTQYSSAISKHLDTGRKGGAYLIIYPFTKTPEWYMLSFGKRKKLMNGHIAVGRKYPQITQLLLYSYGVDDNEFIVSYDTDDLLDFQSLVMELRSDAVRAYTQKDTPIFTCIYKSPEELINSL
jgi:chlorite dismutase